MAREKLTRTCATMEHHFALAEVDETYKLNRRSIETFSTAARLVPRSTVVRIPVVVHVIYRTDSENISQEQIDSQIAALNRDFRLHNADRKNIPKPFRELAVDTLIEFALAVRDPDDKPTTGVTRTKTSKTVFPYDSTDRDSTRKLDQLVKQQEFGKLAWPSSDYLNLWVCSLGGGLLGYAQFPGGASSTDGVVILNKAFGSGGIAEKPFDLGRTAVHEVGHWLNLLHIWGDDGGGCSASDNVHDTPNQGGANTRKPKFPRISCNNGPNGDMFMNYMDYVDDDTMVMFSKGQVERMNATLAGPRASLAQSKGLLPVTSERLDTLVFAGTDMVMSLAYRGEKGKPAELVFDGVNWVPAS